MLTLIYKDEYMGLLKECIKRTKKSNEYIEEFSKTKSEYELVFVEEPVVFKEFDEKTNFTNAKQAYCYKAFSLKVVKKLYILKQFIEENDIQTDTELMLFLNKNPIQNRVYINLMMIYTSSNADGFVANIKESIYNTARKIQFVKYSQPVQEQLILQNEIFKSKNIHLHN